MFSYLLYRIGEGLALCLPSRILYGLAGIISTLQYLFSRQDRDAVRENLKAIFPDINKKLLERYTKGVFINFGLYLANFLRSKKIDLNYLKEHLIIEGLEEVDKALAQKRGLIILSGHIGNWELGGIALGLLGYPINAITLTHKDPRVNQFFNRQREKKGFKAIPLGKAVRGCLEAFSRNEIVCILGDRDFTQGGLVVDFFGRPSLIPKGPAVFFLKNKVPIVMALSLQEDSDKFRLSFSPAIQFQSSGNYEEDLILFTKDYLKRIESSIRRLPWQWAMFRRFWL